MVQPMGALALVLVRLVAHPTAARECNVEAVGVCRWQLGSGCSKCGAQLCCIIQIVTIPYLTCRG